MSQTQDDRADALAALAAGQSVGDDNKSEGSTVPVSLDGAAAPFDQPVQPPPELPLEVTPDLSKAAGGATPADFGQRQAQAARRVASHQRLHAEQYKKTITPILLVVGGVLILMGVFGSYKVLTVKGGYGAGFKLVVLGSFLVGALLLLGAWLFHHELVKHNKRRNGR